MHTRKLIKLLSFSVSCFLIQYFPVHMCLVSFVITFNQSHMLAVCINRTVDDVSLCLWHALFENKGSVTARTLLVDA